ncbi:GNAT superfamily N-acetyltransferase [Streptomyces umbrinus]|uniref:GNAT family N-acetyltransferase n=1 Tax=Streptomyces umbrinus TaxID=67370 RepID=UPI00167D35D6|nr:GNAT family N-acetyltransferase [Streptomyces umbrinus]MCR3731935.1 GNAT superfamily N-acetyltransferase [Streptomyces umbrinus]
MNEEGRSMSTPASGAGAVCAPQVRALGLPGDRERLKNLCPRLSVQSRHMRFHGALNELSEGFLDQLMDVDHDYREALVALEDDEVVGVARYVVTSEASLCAEVTVLVADAWQRQGIATQLLTRLREAARQRGTLFFKASVLPDNDRAQRLISALAPEHHVSHNADGLEFWWKS